MSPFPNYTSDLASMGRALLAAREKKTSMVLPKVGLHMLQC